MRREGFAHRNGAAAMKPLDAAGSITIGNRLEELDRVVEFVEAFGGNYDLPQAVINDLNLCLDELLNNLISYAYDDAGEHAIVINLHADHAAVTAEVKDDGKPFDPRGPREPRRGELRTRPPGGTGLVFVNSLMDAVDYARTGPYNCVRLTKKR
jgi:anti-sigma regulatory factor (Ser/Thr protein kinase)